MRYTTRITALLLAVMTIMCIFSSCNSEISYFSSNIQETEKADKSFHLSSGVYETAAKNEYIELAIDKKNYAVVVKDLTENYTWTALSQIRNDESYAFAVKLYTANGCYLLNTQDNSVAYNAASYKIDGNTLTVSYTLGNNKTTASKKYEDMTKDDIFVILDVKYILNDQSITLSVNAEDIRCSESSVIGSIELMPFFGSADDASGDWFLVPDSSGAIMNTAMADTATESIEISIYGKNPHNSDNINSASATMPVFGIKHSDSAFCAVITEGDALGTIKASRKSAHSDACIGTEITVTETAENANGKTVAGSTYKGNITVVYKFLSGKNATYTAMAAAAREEFIKTSRLSSGLTDASGDIPFSLTLVGSEDRQALTTANQANDILGILKGKGLNNIILTYKGLYNGGTENGSIYTSSVSSKLGGTKGLEQLYRWTEKQGCLLLQGVNIISRGKKGTYSVKSLKSGTASYEQDNDLAYSEGKLSALKTRIGNDVFDIGKEKTDKSIYSQNASFTMNIISLSAFTDSFRRFLDGGKTDFSDGITVTDAGRVLSSENSINRQDAMVEISSMLGAVANYGTLAVEGGNLYSLYNASLITDMRFDTFYPESEAYKSVPFVQSILHGTVLYAGTPIDAGNPLYRYDMLRYIEYGAIPSYEWIYENANVYCYNGYLLSERITETVDFYNDASEMIADVADDRIIGHKEITTDAEGKPVSGVYCTEYSDGTEIYVNYTGSIVTTSGNIAVGPYDYVKVKR